VKKLILSASACIVLAMSCVAPGPVTLPTEGALARQVTRICERHDAYVNADTSLDAMTKSEYLVESQGSVALVTNMPQVPADLLAKRFAPVLDRHDGYVERDTTLDPLEQATYLATASGLRSLLTEARWSQP
jgi:hypothetical protein